MRKAGNNITRAARILGLDIRRLQRRLKTLSARYGPLSTPTASITAHSAFYKTTIETGLVLVGTDAHYWPGEMSTMQRAFLYFVRNIQPRPTMIVMNGDLFDGSRISRHPKIGFVEDSPTIKQELDIVAERLAEIEQAAPKGCQLVWPLGNHDMRYESYLAANSPEMEGVFGMHLKDHFPLWQPCWSIWINEGGPGWTEIKHRFRGGIHATYTNTLHAGVNIVTGHDHDAQLYRKRDRRGKRFGVDAGTLAEVHGSDIGSQFVHYMEANPSNWESCFVVLTYREGRLMRPEFVEKWGETHVEFRGNLVEV
jgi:hypothetical protein